MMARAPRRRMTTEMFLRFGATGEFRCVNATNGDLVWGKNIMTENSASLPDLRDFPRRR